VKSKTPLILALAAALDASAVSLNPDGLGQALIYPYYTVRASEGGNVFNTYISVVNHTSDAKAVRVRVREGRAAKEVASFNLYLSPNDVWAAAVGPTNAGAAFFTTDTSCTDPAFPASSGVSSLEFRNALYTGSLADGFGDTLDRTREGYVEVIEMATLTGASAAVTTHNSAGVPANCAAIRMGPPLVAPPSGGLSGTLTLINVNNGQDFTVNAEALANLSRQPFFRPATDPYPDFAAAEIEPVSAVVANGNLYRSTWSRSVDAVSAALMRQAWFSEYVLDAGTASQTDVVTTMPTRHHYVGAGAPAAPFSQPGTWLANCSTAAGQPLGERLSAYFFDREERGAENSESSIPGDPSTPTNRLCAAVAVGYVGPALNVNGPGPASPTLGSTTLGTFLGGRIRVPSGLPNGWLRMQPLSSLPLTSLASSMRQDLATGAITNGAHVYSGLPVVGFGVRTFRNGTLACGTGACQGNYGGSFPFKYRRSISAP
jgi:hypothetical protein